MSKAPNSVVYICATVVVVAALGSLTLIAVVGGDASQVRDYLNTIMSAATVLLSSGALIYSGAAAKRSNDAANSVNGELDAKIRDNVTAAIDAHPRLNGESDG